MVRSSFELKVLKNCKNFARAENRKTAATGGLSDFIGGHHRLQLGCPFYPRKQTFAVREAMSAKGQKRTLESARDVTSLDLPALVPRAAREMNDQLQGNTN
jgi:hypothetical protein